METQTILITGATSGIGREFARSYAERGCRLVLVARRQEVLDELATELRGRRGVDVVVLPADLADRAGRERLLAQLDEQGIRVDVLVNNAGYGRVKDLLDDDVDTTLGMIELNCAALTHLTRALLPSMVERGRGHVLNVASTAAFQPLPSMGVYAATKSYVLSFSQAIADEVRSKGVTVVALCPGPTDTAFFDVAGADDVMTQRRTPEQVVATGLAALEKGHTVAVDGAVNGFSARLSRVLPFTVVRPLARLVLRHQR